MSLHRYGPTARQQRVEAGLLRITNEERRKAHQDPPESDRLLRNLLAVIHRDGGHHAAQHGLAGSTEEAIKVVHGLMQHRRETEDQGPIGF